MLRLFRRESAQFSYEIRGEASASGGGLLVRLMAFLLAIALVQPVNIAVAVESEIDQTSYEEISTDVDPEYEAETDPETFSPTDTSGSLTSDQSDISNSFDADSTESVVADSSAASDSGSHGTAFSSTFTFQTVASGDCVSGANRPNISQHTGVAGDPFIIADYDDLVCMQELVNNGVISGTITYRSGLNWQFSSFDAGNRTISPIGITNMAFSGNIVGDPHGKTGTATISNLTVVGSNTMGLLGATEGAVNISNLSLINYSVSGTNQVGGLVGRANGSLTVSGVSVVGTVSGTNTDIGGLVGRANGALTVSGVSVSGTVSGAMFMLGGLVGFANSTATFETVTVDGTVAGTFDVGGLVGWASSTATFEKVTVDGTVAGTSSVGGLVGYVIGELTVKGGSSVTGTIKGTTTIGGLVGRVENALELTDVLVVGTVSGTSSLVGGLVGYADSEATFEKVAVDGTVAGTNTMGGLVGRVGGALESTDVLVAGTVSGTGIVVGGLVGYAVSAATLDFENVTVDGKVAGTELVGGLVGYASGAATFVKVTVDGAVAGTNTVGGLAGVAVRKLTVRDVSVAGTVSGTGTRVGGLVGYAMGNENSAATFEKVAVDGTVYGSGNLGGLLGAGSGTVNISQAAVRVTIGEPNSTSASNIGGLIGTLSAASASLRIDNSIVTGTISGQSYLGGLVGALNGAQGSNISATISSVVTAVELSAQTEAVAGLINTLSDSNVDLTSVLNLARVVSSATTDGINQSAALVYGTVSLTNVTADKAYHWLGLSASAATYHPFAFGTVSDTPWKFNGDAVNCSNFSDQSFWTNTESMNLSADVWDFSAITNGYLPALKVLNVPLANQSFSCLNQITYQPDWGSAPTVQTKFGDSTTIPIADNTASIAHYFLANSDSSTAIYRFNAGDEQPFDIFYGSSVARCQLSNDQDWPLPEGGLFLDATISLRTSFCFKADFDFELLQSDGSLWLSWTATHVQSISIHFTTLTNLAGGTPPGISASQFTYQGAASAGSWSLGPPSAGTYIISVSGTMLGIGESQPQIISQSLTWTDYLQPVTPESSVSFPDVFIDGHAKTITYKYNGKVTVSRVAAVTASQYEAIRWLASMAVTVGSQSINGNVATYRPQDLVNRGAMAQFVQKLAGFTDAQIAARFQGHTTTFTDMGSLLKSNPARYYAILWLADTGITVGCNAAGTKFCPANPVNRGSMAELMRKFVGVAATSASTSPFPDVNLTARTLKYDGSSKAVKVAAVNAARMGAINWISGTGITPDSGTFGGVPTYRPQDAINRGAMAEFMRRLAQKVGSAS